MTERETIFDAIDEERDYQNKRWKDPYMELAEALQYMEQYLKLAQNIYYERNNTLFSEFELDIGEPDREVRIKKVLDNIRKVIALGVAAMEFHGVTTRSEETNRNKPELDASDETAEETS